MRDREDDLIAYAHEVYRLAPLVQLDSSVIVAQSCEETNAWTSPRWVNNRNPAGLGIDNDGAPDPATFTGIEAARVHLWALLVACDSIASTELADSLPRLPTSANNFCVRWLAKYADPNCPHVATIDDLNIRYVDSKGEPQATWAWDAAYQDELCARGNALFPGLPDQGGTVPIPATIDYSSLAFPVRVLLIPESQPNQNPGLPLDPTFVTLHETGSPDPENDTAMGEALWVRGGADGQELSVHFFVDAHQAVQIIPLNRVAWHAGDGRNGPGNRTSLAVETVIEPTGLAQARANVRALAALLIRTLPGLTAKGAAAVVPHQRWSGKWCPAICLSTTGCWQSQVLGIAALIEGDPMPNIGLPEGMDRALAEKWFGKKVAAGHTYSFNPDGPVTKAWIAHGRDTGSWPKLAAVESYDVRRYFRFADGFTLFVANDAAEPVVLK